MRCTKAIPLGSQALANGMKRGQLLSAQDWLEIAKLTTSAHQQLQEATKVLQGHGDARLGRPLEKVMAHLAEVREGLDAVVAEQHPGLVLPEA